MSTLKVYQDHYKSLVHLLPMDDSTFIASLFAEGLLPGIISSQLYKYNKLQQTKQRAS